MKKIMILVLLAAVAGCYSGTINVAKETDSINNVLDQWHAAAARADYENYFLPLTEEAVFIGTDATEHWKKAEFKVWAKPYFDKGKAWSFTSLERHIYFDKTGNMAWFDELLDTQMKICRGSGVMTKAGGEWKIEQYVLSMTIPNELSDTIIKIKTPVEEELINHLNVK